MLDSSGFDNELGVKSVCFYKIRRKMPIFCNNYCYDGKYISDKERESKIIFKNFVLNSFLDRN